MEKPMEYCVFGKQFVITWPGTIGYDHDDSETSEYIFNYMMKLHDAYADGLEFPPVEIFLYPHQGNSNIIDDRLEYLEKLVTDTDRPQHVKDGIKLEFEWLDLWRRVLWDDKWNA